MLKTPSRYAPTAETLEPRCVPSGLGVTLSVSPQILRPINPSNQPHAVAVQHVLPVTLAGEVTGAGAGKAAPVVHYQVIDQYGQYQPSGTAQAMPIGSGRFFYFMRVGLSDHRDPRLPGARHYEVIVTAQDAAGSAQSTAVVTVPPAGFFHGVRRRT
jgi:hypothetical protein